MVEGGGKKEGKEEGKKGKKREVYSRVVVERSWIFCPSVSQRSAGLTIGRVLPFAPHTWCAAELL